MTLARYVDHSVVSAFAVEKVNLRPADVTVYRAQVKRLRERLEVYIGEHPDYSLVKMLHSGSVAKGTALRTINDMDVAVYVRSADAPSGEAELLRWMEARLKEALQPLGLKDDQFVPQHHCVTIQYRGSGLDVDVVPVLYEGEANDIGYLIPKDGGDRVKTSVKLHREFIKARKDAHPGDFAQLVRLAKWWVRQMKAQDSNFRFKSFMVELLCAKLVDEGVQLKDYPSALEAFFTYIVKSGLRELVAFNDYYAVSTVARTFSSAMDIYDPVNSENNVAKAYTVSQRDAIVEAAHDALDAITEATYADTKARSVELWRRVLGPSFQG